MKARELKEVVFLSFLVLCCFIGAHVITAIYNNLIRLYLLQQVDANVISYAIANNIGIFILLAMCCLWTSSFFLASFAVVDKLFKE